MRHLVIIIVSLLLVVATWAGWRRHVFNELKIAHPANVAEFESDMTEALARQIFQELQKNGPSAFFLAFGERLTPPSGAFIARFQNVQPRVERFDAAVMPPTGMIMDTSSGRIGLIVQIIKIKPYVVGEYEVEVAISNAKAGWDHFVYRIFNAGGEWRVKGRTPA
ncbi:MAG: hypothetical protein P4N60_23640 [Verrucomicrobiae bacterium]|nr:hypothetical protein [Verrucomicrobiae bacterium]